jgi:membrane-associated phospholipid phosphatase
MGLSGIFKVSIMLDKTARFFSYLLHPLFMPLYGYSLILLTENRYSYFFSLKVKLLLLSIVFTFTCLLPILNLLILYRFKLIRSLRLEDSGQRTFPYLVTTVFYLGMAYLVWDFDIPFIFKALILAGALCISLTLLINLKWKISAHMTGIGGLTGSLLLVSLLLMQNFIPLICLVFALSGMLAFSRLQLKAHTPAQVYTGFLMGMIVSFLFLFLMYIVALHSVN